MNCGLSLRRLSSVLLFSASCGTGPSSNGQANTNALAQAFLHPPASAKPWVNWFWLDGNITRAGITADLEAMQRVGLGGALLMDVTQEIPKGPVRFGSPEWREMFGHTLAEAQRLGLEISLNNAPGWSGSGGPWITPELAMQKLVWSKTNLVGPVQFNALLPALPTVRNFSKDIAVLAFPTLVGDGATVPHFVPKVTASISTGFNGTNLLDKNPTTFVTLPIPTASKPQFIQLEFAEPFLAAQLKLIGLAAALQTFQGVLQISDDGRRFREVRQFSNNRADVVLTFEQVSARYFRILFTHAHSGAGVPPVLWVPAGGLQFSELELTPVYRIEMAQAKAGLGRCPPNSNAPPTVPDYAVIHRRDLMDLTSKTDAEGRLTWDVPPGQWTVLRFGYTPTGRENHPVPPEGLGLECDKLSKEAIAAHFDKFVGGLVAEFGPQTGHAFAAAHIDSWENGYQNWTPRMREEFRQRRGYDLLPYLPAISGRIVESLEVSERFFWDFRQTIAELWAHNYAGHLAELAHQHNMVLSIEAYANGPFNQLEYASRADVPMSEFWLEPEDNSRFQTSKVMASAAHTAGKSVVAAEAFTSYPADAKWQNHPFSLKPLSDTAFCEGVNRLVFHRYAHQPWLDRKPGMTMGPWGVHYERTETWWEQSSAWHEYVARCQFLLQQGVFAADVAYLTEEGAFCDPPTRNRLQPPLPSGYDYDLLSPEALQQIATEEGTPIQQSKNPSIHHSTTPPLHHTDSALPYHVLVLPPTTRTTPQLLLKLRALVEAGATVLGPRPARSPSLADFPECDKKVEQLAQELWGDCDGKTVLEHRLGKGKIVWGKPLSEVLLESGAGQDFVQFPGSAGIPAGQSTRAKIQAGKDASAARELAGRDAGAPRIPLRWIHRRVDGTDFYFVANSNAFPVHADCAFRITGKRPELWHPDIGEIERVAIWRTNATQTVVPLSLDPAGSVFVVFHESSQGAHPISDVLRAGQPYPSAKLWFDAQDNLQLLTFEPGLYELRTASSKTLTATVTEVPKLPIEGPWDLEFPPNSGAPPRVTLNKLISWSAHTNAGVRYFSGTATYQKNVNIPPEFLAKDLHLWLDLGDVQVIAQVKLNGKELGTLWKPPFLVEITSVAEVGDNVLEIGLVNLWPNRLIGDEQLPDDCRWQSANSGQGFALAEWPQWLLDNKPSPTGRLTFSTWKHWAKQAPLLPSGLLGPVTLVSERATRLQ